MWNGAFGGSCPLNCTHVWNYEQALAKTFPSLERSMRETEFDIMQAPEGYIPHRVVAPVYLRQMWGEVVGGPNEPALDGMLGTVLKTWREVRQGAGRRWLVRYWPNIQRLLAYVAGKWDPQGSGMLHGIQPSTHDIDLAGLNTFMGTLWLAALRAAEEMALMLGEGETASGYRQIFERGSASYDKALFNGAYYVQKLESGDSPAYQWQDGCLADQLIGQWWAHELGLGYLLPEAHVKSALRAIVRHNLREGFGGFEHGYRVYADEDDTGLLICTWPRNGRPAVPVRYADEVWTGVEYQVAAHCLREGLSEEAHRILAGMWKRHDGRRRNPYNEIECGDHYARAMAGWSVLEAMAGYHFDAERETLSIAAADQTVAWPFVAGTGWGRVHVSRDELRLECLGGALSLSRINVAKHPATNAQLVDAPIGTRPVVSTQSGLGLSFPDKLTVRAGETVRFRLS
jgi:hypothetical protein